MSLLKKIKEKLIKNSNEKKEVPKVVGMKVADAVALLKKCNVKYRFAGFKEVVPKNVMEGTVKSQDPRGGSALSPKTIVKLYINMDLMM